MTQHTPSRAAPASRTVEPPLRRTALALMVAGCFNAAHANPVAPQVVNGQATFNPVSYTHLTLPTILLV